MRKIDKFIFSILLILFLLIALFLLLFPFNLTGNINVTKLTSLIITLKNSYITSLIGLIILLTIVIYVGSFFSYKSNNKYKVLEIENKSGRLTIHDSTIIGLVRESAKGVEGIDNIKTYVEFVDNKILINIKCNALPEINIPQATSTLQMRIKEHVENSTGAEVSKVNIEIIKLENI